MIYGLTEDKIKEIRDSGDAQLKDGKLLCFACYQDGNPKYYKAISPTHLKKYHDMSIAEYLDNYPGVEVRMTGLGTGSNSEGNYTGKTVGRIFKEIEKMGISKWAEKEGLELYERQKILADSLQAEGKYSEARITRNEAKKLLIQFLPSRSQRNTDDEINEATKEDKEVLSKQDEMLDMMKKDLKTKNNTVSKAWFNRDEKVLIYSSSEEIPRSV